MNELTKFEKITAVFTKDSSDTTATADAETSNGGNGTGTKGTGKP